MLVGKLKASGLTKKQMKSISDAYDYEDEMKLIFGFPRVYNYNAYQLLQWAENTKNRIKAYKLIQQAIKLEKRYREFYWFWILFTKDTSKCAFPTVIQYKPEYYWKL